MFGLNTNGMSSDDMLKLLADQAIRSHQLQVAQNEYLRSIISELRDIKRKLR